MGGTVLDARDVTVVVAMGVEARPVRRLLPSVRLIRAGIGLASLDRAQLGSGVVLSVGVAGGLDARLATGTVVVPAHVATDDGVLLACDDEWSAALAAASRRLGFPTVDAPILSSAALVTGAARASWSARGFAAADMETAPLRALVARVAAVRVVLDTPLREISPAWERPAVAALDPRNWREGAWLARATPWCSKRAAQVVAAAIAAA